MGTLSELSDGSEPHGTIPLTAAPLFASTSPVGGEGVPGVVGSWVVPGGAIPVPRPSPVSGPYLVIF